MKKLFHGTSMKARFMRFIFLNILHYSLKMPRMVLLHPKKNPQIIRWNEKLENKAVWTHQQGTRRHKDK